MDNQHEAREDVLEATAGLHFGFRPPHRRATVSVVTRRKRSESRRRRIVAHRTTSYADADLWDLQFWQGQTPEARLSALVAIREDIRRVRGRNKARAWES
jgi:hypothetical protein